MKKLFSILLLIGISQALFSQEKVYFPAYEIINVHVQHQYVTSKLFKNYVDANGQYEIVLPENLKNLSNNSMVYSETKEETREKALELKTSYFIMADMSAIGDLLIVNMKMYNTSSNQLIWSDALKANQLEDLDKVIRLFANALGTEELAVESGDIYSVTQYDSEELNKRQATLSWGVTFGGGAILAKDTRNASMSGFGIMKSYDIRNLILDIKTEFYFGEATNATRLGMNLLVPLTKNNTSLFYGGGIYYGGMSYEYKHKIENTSHWNSSIYREVHNSGIELEGNFGIIFNRLASLQLRATVTPVIATYKINGNAAGAIRFGLTATF